MNTIFVHYGISGGQWFATFTRRHTGSLRRICSKDLPIRKTREEAEADLAKWLERRAA